MLLLDSKISDVQFQALDRLNSWLGIMDKVSCIVFWLRAEPAPRAERSKIGAAHLIPGSPTSGKERGTGHVRVSRHMR